MEITLTRAQIDQMRQSAYDLTPGVSELDDQFVLEPTHHHGDTTISLRRDGSYDKVAFIRADGTSSVL